MGVHLSTLPAGAFCVAALLCTGDRVFGQAGIAERTGAAVEPASDEQTLRGRIAAMDGRLGLVVSDDDGCIEHVKILPATTVTPRGLALSVSMRITVHGHMAGTTFVATAIHAHYVYTGEHPSLSAVCR